MSAVHPSVAQPCLGRRLLYMMYTGCMDYTSRQRLETTQQSVPCGQRREDWTLRAGLAGCWAAVEGMDMEQAKLRFVQLYYEFSPSCLYSDISRRRDSLNSTPTMVGCMLQGQMK